VAPATETTAEAEPAGTAAGVTLPRAVDATPSESDLQAED